MKPAPFQYHRASTTLEAVALIDDLGEEAKFIAGGQSLVPMMNFRLARPSALIDIMHIGDLDSIQRDGDALVVGALTRHRTLETSTDPSLMGGFALLPTAARWIGHTPIRTRGTIGGSLMHADASAEWCMMARLFNAQLCLEGPRGRRTVAADDWFQGMFSTAADFNELLVEIRFTTPRQCGALAEFSRRHGDFATAAVAVAFDVVDDRLCNVGIVIGGVEGVPVRAGEAETLLEGASVGAVDVDGAARSAAAGVAPMEREPREAAYRRHLVDTLTRRAIHDALATGVQ